MKTEHLIAALANQAGPAPRAVVTRRLAPALLFGVAASALLSLTLLGPLRDTTLPGAALWIKLFYAAAFAGGAAWLTGRLSRPAAPVAAAAVSVGIVVLVMAAVGAISLLALDPAERVGYALGGSWAVCPWAVLGLSLPGLAATLWAVRGLAPTRPAAAGFAAGLLAGAAGAAGYALHCIEPSTLFIAIWYTLGIALCGGLGAVLGPRALRW